MRKFILLALALGLALAVASAHAQTDLDERIEAANLLFTQRFASSNARQMATLYSNNGRLLTPRHKPAQGTSAIEQWWGNFFKESPARRVELATVRSGWIDSSTTAFELGGYRFVDQNGVQLEIGKYIVVWREESGSFRRLGHAFNSNSGSGLMSQASRLLGSAAGNASEEVNVAAEQLLLDLTGRNVDFMRSWASHDLPALGSYFQTGANYMVQGRPSINGRDAITQYFRQLQSDTRSFLLAIDSVGVSSRHNAAYELGRYEQKASSGRILESGSYLTIWVRTGGAWLRSAVLLNPHD